MVSGVVGQQGMGLALSASVSIGIGVCVSMGLGLSTGFSVGLGLDMGLGVLVWGISHCGRVVGKIHSVALWISSSGYMSLWDDARGG